MDEVAGEIEKLCKCPNTAECKTLKVTSCQAYCRPFTSASVETFGECETLLSNYFRQYYDSRTTYCDLLSFGVVWDVKKLESLVAECQSDSDTKKRKHYHSPGITDAIDHLQSYVVDIEKHQESLLKVLDKEVSEAEVVEVLATHLFGPLSNENYYIHSRMSKDHRCGCGCEKNVKHGYTGLGPSMKNAGSYMTAAVLCGLIQNSSLRGAGDTSSLNLISAPVLAKQYGINSTSTYEAVAPAPYTAMVSVVFSNGFQISGSTSGGNTLLVEIQGQKFLPPACLTNSALVFKGTSNPQLIPGVAGAVAGPEMTLSSLCTSAELEGQKWGIATFAATPSENCLEALRSVVTVARLITF